MAYEEIRKFVESRDGFMQYCRKVRGVQGGVWVISIQGRVGVFSKRGGESGYPELDDLYHGTELRPNAEEQLYDRLEKINYS